MRQLCNLMVMLLPLVAGAQLPETDLWLFRIKPGKDSTAVFQSMGAIVKRPGYDNQPVFSKDNKAIFFSSGQDGKTDIYRYDISKKKITPAIVAPESDFSPGWVPGSQLMAVVRVEADSAQHVHYVDPMTGVDKQTLPIDSVGYYTFLNNDTLLYYKLTKPHSLRCISLSNGQESWIGNLPFRSFRTVNRHTFLYGLGDTLHTTLYRYCFLKREAERVAELPASAGDFRWTSTLGLLCTRGSQLLKLKRDGTWEVILDFNVYGISRITRFSLSDDGKYLCIVDMPGT